MIRAILDVNVVVSALLAPRGTTRQVLAAWEERRFVALTSEGIIANVEEKLLDPDIGGTYGVTSKDILWIRGLLRTQAQVVGVPPSAVVAVTNDPEDDYVLASAACGQANYLVTGDKKLQKLRTYQGVTIVSPREFLDILTSKHT